jgi:hypothetical protein
MSYTGSLFWNPKKSEPQLQQKDFDKLVTIQASQLRGAYKTDCLDVKQLQQVLNVGESNAYEWVKTCPAVRIIGRRKVVPVVWVAYYLVTDTM